MNKELPIERVACCVQALSEPSASCGGLWPSICSDQREAELLYVLAEERLVWASTILTSNRPREDWCAVFPDTVVGGAILDRLVSSATKIITTRAGPVGAKSWVPKTAPLGTPPFERSQSRKPSSEDCPGRVFTGG